MLCRLLYGSPARWDSQLITEGMADKEPKCSIHLPCLGADELGLILTQRWANVGDVCPTLS